jgi:hypothetical protein
MHIIFTTSTYLPGKMCALIKEINMKKLVLVTLLVVVAVLALGGVGYAYAQSRQPGNGANGSGAYGPGMMGGWGQQGGRGMMNGGGMMGGGYGMMGFADEDGDGYGPMHDYMLAGFAEAFGLTVDELQAQLDAGETPYTIAIAQGMTDEEFQALVTEIHSQTLSQLVADGVITQAQADWMTSHMSQMWQGGYGPGSGGCPMHGGEFGGRGGRWNNNNSDQQP